MSAAKTEPVDGVTHNRTDLRNAELLVDWFGADLRYCSTWGKWLAWDDQRWAIDDAGRAHRLAKETARRLLALALNRYGAASEALAKATASSDEDAKSKAENAVAHARLDVAHAIRSQGAKRIDAMLDVAQSDPAIVIHHTALDANPWLLNVANGTIDLKTGERRDHAREDLMSKLAPVAFDHAAKCPTWDKFVARAMADDAELVDFLARLIGYALTGTVDEHVLAFFFGGGANGKSTFNGTIHAMLGDYATPAPRGLLFRSRGDQHPTGIASLHGRRFVTCSEIGEGQAFDEELIKDLTGGDPIEARRMREDFWSYTPTHKLFLAGNHKPTVRGDDEGIWRRIRLVPWTVTIPADERDPLLPTKLRAELPGILAWAVRGCLAWQKEGLDPPSAVTAATSAYRAESDALGEFFATYLRFEATGRTPRKALRELYEKFCQDNGAEPLGAKRFAGRLRERGVDGVSIKLRVTVVFEGKNREEARVVDGWKGVRIASERERVLAADPDHDDAGRAVGTGRARDPVRSYEQTGFPETIPESTPTKSLPPTADPDDLASYLDREGIGT